MLLLLLLLLLLLFSCHLREVKRDRLIQRSIHAPAPQKEVKFLLWLLWSCDFEI